VTDREQRIRDIAYFLWLEEGRPEGEAERHWRAAEGLVGAEPEGVDLVASEPEEQARVEGDLPREPKKKEPLSIATVGSD
jgi:hypothetical protein